jgi:AAA+ superfamily predicted ATPase
MKKALKEVAQDTKYSMHYWSACSGITEITTGKSMQCPDPLDAFEKYQALPKKSMMVLQDIHMVLVDVNPGLIDIIRIAIIDSKKNNKILIFCGVKLTLPIEIEKEFSVINFDLPDREQLGVVLDSLIKSIPSQKKHPDEDLRKRLIDAATGLTAVEAENAFALSIVENKKEFDPLIVSREKAETIKKSGVLEIMHPSETADDIGGLDLMKAWLNERKKAFTPEAREYGLPSPRGILIIGIPGTGKSLTAKATANILQRPIVKLDVGRVFGGIVGESEANIRMVTKTAEAIAPCVLFIDELEKGFSGTKSSNSSDGGTSSRVFGHFIDWMQERKAPVFIVATANDVSQLPVEFLRKGGRWDELFFCNLPDAKDRLEIFQIQMRSYKRKPSDYDCKEMAEHTDGFTGAEIQQVIVDTLFSAFNVGREPNNDDFMKTIKAFVPLSLMMHEEIGKMRTWAKNRARPASSQVEEVVVKANIGNDNRVITLNDGDPF